MTQSIKSNVFSSSMSFSIVYKTRKYDVSVYTSIPNTVIERLFWINIR